MQPARLLLQLALNQQQCRAWPGSGAALASAGAAAGAQWRRGAAAAAGARGFSAAAAPDVAPPPQLADIMHLEALAGKTPDEVEAIWLQYHEDPTQRRVADVMAADEFRQMRARVRASPMFVLPLGKPGGGFLTTLLNWQGPQALVTTLEEYKRFSGGAPTHMTLTHYTDLAASHGLVLVRGEVINDHVINMAEGRTLLQLVRAFYTDPHAHRLVYRFNHEQSKFDVGELLALLGHKGGGGGGAAAAAQAAPGSSRRLVAAAARAAAGARQLREALLAGVCPQA